MNFTAKIVLAIVASTTAGAVASPMVATAGPTTGSTAAAVSIKFQKSGTGNLSIAPGSTTSAGGSGIQELSAAVATGETKASAEAQSTNKGTSATANGYSQPVYFSYETHNDLTTKKSSSDYAYKSDFKAEAAIEFAAGQKTSSSFYGSETEKLSIAAKGKKVTTLTAEEITVLKAKAASEANLKLVASAEASASKSGSGSQSSQSSVSEVGTSYEYKGSSAGLQFLPALVK
jgi:predicted regulator of Ras-like GTPase activity (Roadblock/LC7/MglB family)